MRALTVIAAVTRGARRRGPTQHRGQGQQSPKPMPRGGKRPIGGRSTAGESGQVSRKAARYRPPVPSPPILIVRDARELVNAVSPGDAACVHLLTRGKR